MTEVSATLKKQAAWQNRRRDLSWPEKIRLAEEIRASIEALRRSRPRATAPALKPPPAPA
jgi:hypothetical protein